MIRHVLMTIDAVGGVWTYGLDLARDLGDRGVSVSLAIMGPPPSDAQRQEATALPHVSVAEAPFRLEWMDDPWEDVEAAGDWLLQLEGEIRPDVVHLNAYAHAALPWRAPVLVVGHSCVLSWWSAVHGGEAPRRFERYASAVRRGLRQAHAVVAPTPAMLAALEHHYGPLPCPHVIANGRWAAAYAGDPARKEPIVLSAGRLWDEAKNVGAVCAVAPHLPWAVSIAGASTRPGGADTAPPAGGVQWLGALGASELASWMARASIFALPARYEPFGLCPVEAALAGCALVLGDIRSLREVWGDAAVYVPPDNRRALQVALASLIEDAGLRRAMAERASRRARELTPERMGEGYMSLYSTLSGARAAAAS